MLPTMKSSNPRIERIRELLSLEEQRAQLQSQLDELSERMSTLKDRLFEEGNASSQAASSPAVQQQPKASGSKSQAGRSAKGRAPRGALKEQIMTALQAAGNAGVQVRELAEAIGTKAVNIHSWFHSTAKRDSSIKKVAAGHYRLDGTSSNSTKASSPAKASSGRKPAKASAQSSTGATGKRGQLSSRILAELEKAGDQGLSVKDLSEKVGAKYKNISIWFATTGKKNSSVRKVGRGQYRLVG